MGEELLGDADEVYAFLRLRLGLAAHFAPDERGDESGRECVRTYIVIHIRMFDHLSLNFGLLMDFAVVAIRERMSLFIFARFLLAVAASLEAAGVLNAGTESLFLSF
jgi:hypothetical protein